VISSLNANASDRPSNLQIAENQKDPSLNAKIALSLLPKLTRS
jgi:hypothetical protein